MAIWSRDSSLPKAHGQLPDDFHSHDYYNRTTWWRCHPKQLTDVSLSMRPAEWIRPVLVIKTQRRLQSKKPSSSDITLSSVGWRRWLTPHTGGQASI
ncbi:RhoGAP domain protein [Aspergillus luchuensis]|uniref:RhoGAP domain protein n=1 Tax=Aspergillus kawachii TaxID=1069201 RepID=A0A146FMN9_ASPKA|nr:RhoGAP domain protein [Aspergillus luchuensis]